MSIMSLDELIRSDVLDEVTSRDTITRIKAAAIHEFELLDSRVNIHNTQYFNHSFAPDIVLSWPGSQIRERYVYLRSTQQPDLLSEDVDRLGDQEPIVLGLGQIPRETISARSRLHENAQDRNTLVTDAPALTSIEEAKRSEPVASLLSSVIVRGGRGLVGDDEARQVAAAVTAGFQGAEVMGADAVLRATEALTSTLSDPFASNFGRVLQAVWIGSGGRSDLYPATRLTLANATDDDTLEFLLDLDPINDWKFWRRVGSAVSVEQLGRLRVQVPNANLQMLISANLDRLQARTFRLRDSFQPTFDDIDRPTYYWTISRSALTFQGPNWEAYIAELAENLGSIRGSLTDGVAVPELRRRATDIALISLQLSDGRMAFNLNSLQQADVINSEQLHGLESTLGSTAKVHAARAVSGGRQITCDFRHSVASTPGSNIIGAADLLRTGLRLMRSLSDDELELLEEALNTNMAAEADLGESLVMDFSDDDGPESE